MTSQVTPRGNSERVCGKQNLSKKVTLTGVMGMVSTDIRDRTVKLEGLSLNEATAPPTEDMLEQEMFEVDEVTAGLGVGKEGALSSGHGSSDSEDWNHLIEVESRRMEGAVAKYQPSISSGDDGEKDSKPAPHQVQERTTPLGSTIMEDLQVFHKSQGAMIVDFIELDYWSDAEEHLMELEQASTWFLG